LSTTDIDLANFIRSAHASVQQGANMAQFLLSDDCRKAAPDAQGAARPEIFTKSASGSDPMKVVVAVIEPFKLNEVREALTWVGIFGMTVTEVKEYGEQRGHTEIYRGAEYAVKFVPKIKVEVAVPARLVDKVVGAILETAAPGQSGSGTIFVASVDQIMRIRTGETDAAAF
jgi:nitrogen regulatory protein P-II 2